MIFWRWSILVVVAALSLRSNGAEPDRDQYKYKWRLPEGRTHVLWVGGGHWHDTLQTASILRGVLEGSGRFHVTYSEDTASLKNLDRYDVVLLNGMIDRFAPGAERALVESVGRGRPLLVLHAASACFRSPPPAKQVDPTVGHENFFKMIGGYVLKHDPFGRFQVRITDPDHSIVASVESFEIEDELFEFRELREDNHVLLAAESDGHFRPIAWTRESGNQRVFHLSLGHNEKAAMYPVFQRLIVNGLDWLILAGGSNE
ncbi:ThuA domain-containing protein [Crateriforma conspicua]|uniref:Trehalose utilization n=1 Tax=Crateriforma conspicua TaxID=2527996 RepID=A0A5C6FNQ3_9PLAN|nr:ThuA domain-containing protein [Crateriforma conspicua]TWU64599.1 Trehalose utilization [Crateriforma conspicua]